ncbi:hypothetical protein [Maliponia aquimaris]|uniref:Uncharacterized protein n=1 Tax=Maliponia aquimaris TaxID=1673631 RepID=A0A238L521_9RHOB|nr:hypothetical protein [Maliponia aquimaris]SMX49921.1 hypothetical protein MAA8898_04507 [Maliponia aquimaris]
MFDFPSTNTAIHRFVHEHGEALQNAALLLGGPAWLKRTRRLIDALSREPRMTRKIRQEAQALYGLLSLEHVQDFDRPESWYFGELDLEAPYIAENCQLTEALADAIETVDAEGCA